MIDFVFFPFWCIQDLAEIWFFFIEEPSLNWLASESGSHMAFFLGERTLAWTGLRPTRLTPNCINYSNSGEVTKPHDLPGAAETSSSRRRILLLGSFDIWLLAYILDKVSSNTTTNSATMIETLGEVVARVIRVRNAWFLLREPKKNVNVMEETSDSWIKLFLWIHS